MGVKERKRGALLAEDMKLYDTERGGVGRVREEGKGFSSRVVSTIASDVSKRDEGKKWLPYYHRLDSSWGKVDRGTGKRKS